LVAEIEVDAIHAAREYARASLVAGLEKGLVDCYHDNSIKKPYRYDPVLAGRRRLKNLCLSYLVLLGRSEHEELCFRQFQAADNMSDEISSLQTMVHAGAPQADEALALFEEKWRNDPLVMDKWLAVQATAPLPTTLERVKKLMDHSAFDLKNPNRVRSLLGAFSQGNPVAFNCPSGEAYGFMAGQILELDKANPQIAARMAGCFSRWHRFPEKNRALQEKQLERIKGSGSLSKDLFEVVSKTLGD
ncbi:MAG: aminopeptidase N C-terminal domain-containing protein, partial [Thermodesulfobacteriota bacterium]